MHRNHAEEVLEGMAGDAAADGGDGAEGDQEEERIRRHSRQPEEVEVHHSRHSHLGAWVEALRNLEEVGKDFAAARTYCAWLVMTLRWQNLWKRCDDEGSTTNRFERTMLYMYPL